MPAEYPAGNCDRPERLAPAMLAEYGALTRATLDRYLDRGDACAFLRELVADYPRRGGRMMRPAICIAAARAFGAHPEDAIATAVAIELLHNALLVHDDIEDASVERRGRPTLHRMHGVPLALNAGDALALMSLAPLFENRARLGTSLAMRLLEETARTAAECADGQALELGWRDRNILNVRPADYLEMALKKTCWLAVIHPLRAGVLIATRGAANPDDFVRFGFLVGAAFQIQDDLLNLVGGKSYGKERDGDLWEGKRTLILIRLMALATTGERTRLAAILAAGRTYRTAADVSWMRGLIDRYRCIEYARRVAHGLAGAALHEFAERFAGVPDSRDKRFLEELATWVIERA